jgi:hypothetical protein
MNSKLKKPTEYFRRFLDAKITFCRIFTHETYPYEGSIFFRGIGLVFHRLFQL